MNIFCGKHPPPCTDSKWGFFLAGNRDNWQIGELSRLSRGNSSILVFRAHSFPSSFSFLGGGLDRIWLFVLFPSRNCCKGTHKSYGISMNDYQEKSEIKTFQLQQQLYENRRLFSRGDFITGGNVRDSNGKFTCGLSQLFWPFLHCRVFIAFMNKECGNKKYK